MYVFPGHSPFEDQTLVHPGRSPSAGTGGSEQLLHGHMELTRRVASARTVELPGAEEGGGLPQLPREVSPSPTPARMFCVC